MKKDLKEDTKIIRHEGTKDYRKSSLGEILQKLHIVTDHSPLTTHYSLKKAAFTLAEVLITLTVIGVVAAITLPPLIQNYQKQVLVNQLKKSYSTVSQAFQKMMADEGVDDVLNLPDDENGIGIGVDKKVDLGKYLKITNIKDEYSAPAGYKFLNGEPFNVYAYYTINLADGTILYTGNFINIDVNGKKGPNVQGRDLFCFGLERNGKLVPSGYYSNDAEINKYCSPGGDAQSGQYCATRIMRDGWKMNY